MLRPALKNTALLLVLILTILSRTLFDPTLTGLIVGSLSLYLFYQIQKYGLRQTFLQLDRHIISVLPSLLVNYVLCRKYSL